VDRHLDLATQFPTQKPPNGSSEQLLITLTEERLREVLRDGLALHRTAVAAQPVELRVAIQDLATGAIGSIQLKLACR
jgi:hypothetical protein